jgi:hypothetical protein
MPLVLKDRVKETSTTTGTGTLTLGGAATGFQSFAVIGDGNTTYYAIFDRTSQDWEVGVGTYTSSGTTLTRDTVLESSNSGSLVNFGAGAKDVFCTYPAEKAVTLDDVQTLTNKTINLANNTLIATSAQLAAAITDETGTGSVVFSVSPALTGTPTSPTAAAGTNTTQIATTAHVFAERSNTATLTNKTISADNNTLSGIAASSFVLSNASGNIDGAADQKAIPSGVVVGTTDTQTLTNKTLTNPTINGFTGDTSVINIGSGQFYKDASGNVGIGTSSPGAKLDLWNSSSAGGGNTLRFTNATTGIAAEGIIGKIEFYSEDASAPGASVKAFIASVSEGTSPDGALVFATDTNTGTPTERMRISSNGQQQSVIPGGTTLYPEFKCRAWVNFNGTGTPAIRNSGNVSSITDGGTGIYTVNFTTAMPDANYSVTTAVQKNSNGSSTENLALNSLTTTGVVLRSSWSNNTVGGLADVSLNCVAVFR